MAETAPTLELLAKEVARIVQRGEVDLDISVGELGVDSLMLVELMLACDQIYPGAIDMDAPQLEITQFTTLRELDQKLGALAAANA
jgi:acyl carrier protein